MQRWSIWNSLTCTTLNFGSCGVAGVLISTQFALPLRVVQTMHFVLCVSREWHWCRTYFFMVFVNEKWHLMRYAPRFNRLRISWYRRRVSLYCFLRFDCGTKLFFFVYTRIEYVWIFLNVDVIGGIKNIKFRITMHWFSASITLL